MYSHCEYTYSTTNQLTRKARIELVSPYNTSSCSKWKTNPTSSGTKNKHETGQHDETFTHCIIVSRPPLQKWLNET